MPFHLCGFTESQDSATLVNVAALADPSLNINGDDLAVPAFAPNLIGVLGLGADATRVQLVAPSLRRIVNYEVNPLDLAALPTSPSRAVMFPSMPIPLRVDERLNAQAAEGGAGATRVTVLVWLADGPVEAVAGEIYTVRVTNASTLVANAWTNGQLTFDQTLPVGQYALVGAAFRSTNMQAFRFVGVGNDGARPGGIGTAAASGLPPVGQRRGGWGTWLTFKSTTPPTVDFLANGADSSQVGELDLIYLGA